MDRRQHRFIDDPDRSVSRSISNMKSDIIRRPSGEILTLLNGLEMELKSRNRLQRHNARHCTTGTEECGNVVNKIAYGPKRYVTKDFTENKYTDIEFPEEVLYELKYRSLSSDVKRVNGSIENPSLKQNPSLNKDTEEHCKQGGQKEIPRIRNKVEPLDYIDLSSYVDFSLSRPEVKWHKGQRGFMPQNSFPIGYTKLGNPLYAGRTWNEERSYLVPSFVDVDEGKCFYGKGDELRSTDIYEIMECKFVAWDDAEGTPVTKLPPLAYQAGYNERDEPLYFGRAFIDGAVTPGYIEERYFKDAPDNHAFALIIPFRDNVLCIFDTYEVMIVIPADRNLIK